MASAPTVPRRRRPGAELRRLRRLIALGRVGIVYPVNHGATQVTGGGGTPATETRGPRPATTLLPSGPPRPQILASRESVQLNVPIAQSRITAIAYHRVAGAETLDLRPHGRLLNAGLFRDLERRMLGTSDPGGPDYFIADGSTASVDVGAPAGTQVYAPVDGHVIGILPNMVNGEARGSFIQIQPNDNPAEIVQLSHIVERPGNEVYVGKSVTASRTLIGTVEDLSGVLELTLARYTRDAGNHVHIEVQPSTNIPIP